MDKILYSYRRCPYAMRARLALCSANIEYEHREINLQNKAMEFLSASPKGTVPVLVIDAGAKVIDESLDIMLWALKQNSKQKLLPSLQDLELSKQIIRQNDGFFKTNLDRYKYPDRYNLKQATFEEARKNCVNFLSYLDLLLNKNSFILSAKPTLVDIAVLPFIRQFAKVDFEYFDRLAYPRLRDWFLRFMNSEILTKIMQKYPTWESDSLPIIQKW